MNNVIKNNEIEVTKRSIYNPYGRGRKTTYDAVGTLRGVEYNVTASSRKEAIEQAKAEIAYLLSAGSFEAGSCAVRPIGFQSWEFALPGRVVMSYGATDLAAAVAKAAESYSEHEDAQEFVRAVRGA